MVIIKKGILHFPAQNPVSGLDILIEGDRISRIAADIEVSDAVVIDAKEKHVFPGFILPVTSIGIVDYANLRRGDADESSNPLNAAVHVRHALDVREVALQGYRRSGITTFGCAPGRGSLIAGQMGVYHTYGHRVQEMCVKDTVAIKGNFTQSVKSTFTARSQPPMTRMGMAALLRRAIQEALRYKPEKDDPDDGKEALARVLAGELPLLINADLPGEIETVISIAKEFGIRTIIHGAYTAHTLYDMLVEGKYPLLLGDLHNFGAATEYETNLSALISMRAAGMPLALSNSGDASVGHECLLWNAARMVQAGIDPEEAIRMITIDTARILGIDDSVGSLEEGKYADIVIYSDHPLRTWQAAVDTFIVAGKIIQAEEEGY